jgi:hypothetical protein
MCALKLIAQLIFLPAPILFDLLSGADLFGAEVCSVFLSTAYVFFVSVLVIFVLAQLAPPLHQGLTFANLLFHSRRSVAEDASRLCLCRLPPVLFCSSRARDAGLDFLQQDRAPSLAAPFAHLVCVPDLVPSLSAG